LIPVLCEGCTLIGPVPTNNPNIDTGSFEPPS